VSVGVSGRHIFCASRVSAKQGAPGSPGELMIIEWLYSGIRRAITGV